LIITLFKITLSMPINGMSFQLRLRLEGRKGKERKGKERKGKESKGKKREAKERKGKQRKGKKREAKERKEKGSKAKQEEEAFHLSEFLCFHLSVTLDAPLRGLRHLGRQAGRKQARKGGWNKGTQEGQKQE
jgi:hypothetical protein